MYKQAIRRIIQDIKQIKEDNQKFTSANDMMKKQLDVMEKKKKVIYEVLEGDKIDKNKIQRIIGKKKSNQIEKQRKKNKTTISDQFEARIASQKRQLREDQLKIEKYEKELAAVSRSIDLKRFRFELIFVVLAKSIT